MDQTWLIVTAFAVVTMLVQAGTATEKLITSGVEAVPRHCVRILHASATVQVRW